MTLACGSATSAADLGVLTSLDVCSSLGVSGLSISSDSNCLTISGEVTYSMSWGDYDVDADIVDDLAYSGSGDVFVGDGVLDWESAVETALSFAGQTDSTIGPVDGIITLESTDEVVVEDLALDDETHEIVIDEAYISIGDATILMVGLKDSIGDDGHDTSFTYQEMFNEDEASGVGFNSDTTNTDIDDGSHVIQVVSDLGNGLKVGAALEDLDDVGTLVGVVQYSNDTVVSHVTFWADEILTGTIKDWAVHAGATVTLDKVRMRAAAAFNNDGWWNVLGTAETKFDIFTLAVAAEATSADEFGAAGSLAANVADGVILNLASRAFVEADDDLTIDSVVEVEYELTETITLVAGLGYIHESDRPDGTVYGLGGLTWTPGGDFEAELGGRVHNRPGNDLGYEITFEATKSFD